MGKSRAARREQRKEKREIAQATRDTKYANQKGGVGKKRRRLSSAPSQAPSRAVRHDDDDGGGDDMVVIRAGQAVRASSGSGVRARAPPDDPSDGDDDEALPQRFSSEEKKLRALKKKLRSIEELKRRRKQGAELDSHQQAKVRAESEVLRLISQFGSACADVGGAVTEPAHSSEEEVLDDAPCPAPSYASTLKQRREQKRLRRLERLGRTIAK